MGCGILFPPDFSPDGDADDEADDLDSSPGDEELTDDGEGQLLRFVSSFVWWFRLETFMTVLYLLYASIIVDIR